MSDETLRLPDRCLHPDLPRHRPGERQDCPMCQNPSFLNPLSPPNPLDTEPPQNFKSYLGDGAYVDMGSFMGEVVLTTENGIRETNRVVLGPHEMVLLCRWLRTHLQWEIK